MKSNEWLMLVTGILSIAIGCGMFALHQWRAGSFGLVGGPALIVIAFATRRDRKCKANRSKRR